MGEHTKGPWEISPARTVDGEAMVVGGEGREFGLIAQVTTDEDASLIVAAPDMLAALRLVSALDIDSRVLKRVDAAIAKAESGAKTAWGFDRSDVEARHDQ